MHMTDRSKSLTCIELFAGAGGMMLGLEEAGFKTLVANEIHADPCKTLRRNFPDTPIINAPVQEVDRARLFDAAGLKRGFEVDLVAGGPPCQGFSTAGLKDPDDPRNTLIGDFIRLVKEIRPRFFIMENVPGLATLHKGRLFENVLNEFSATSYSFRWAILKVADYGVPQMRKRLVVFGSRDGEAPRLPDPSHSSNEISSQASFFQSLPPVTCWQALSDLPQIEQGEIALEYDKPPATEYQKRMRKGAKFIFNHEASKHKPQTAAYYALIPPGGNVMQIPDHLRKKKEGIQRWPVNGLSRAITTEPTDFLHPHLHRIPTVRELARIQSFPDHYEFMGQRTTGNKMRRLGYCSQTQQVGNAVPPIFAEALGKAIFGQAV